MGDNMRRKCLKCGRSPREDPDIKLYRFPNPGPTNSQRCELWTKYCFPEGTWSSIDFQRKLYGEHRMLCNQHFKKSSFTNFAEKKLNRHAVPDTEHFENQPTIETAAQPETSHFPTNPIPGPSQRRELMNITNIKKSKVGDSVDNILLDTSIDLTVPQPGPSGVPFKKKKKLDSKLVPVSNIPSVSTTKGNDPAYQKCRNYMKRICQLKNKIKKMKTKHIFNVVNESDAVQNLMKRLTPSLALILQGELKNAKRKYKGRRWTTEQKIIGLRIYKRSPATYRLLRRLWCLPAPSTLKNTLGQFRLTVGLNEKIFKSLKSYVKTQEPVNNEYALMFDEMSIKKHLWYNKKEDKVEGYQDHGKHGRSKQEATHALVFMVTGIRKKVKQPVAFYLSSSYVTADRLSVLIKDVLQKCFENGINIAATVCDMGGVNRRALTLLGATKDCPYFNYAGHEVVTIFDPPHLLKCFRNMFQKYNIKCTTNIKSNNVEGEGIAKWKHIEDFFEIDNQDGNFVFAPKLRKDHINPNAKQKMRVNLAAQVLSHSVAAGMFARISQGLLPAEATATAEVISNIDKLFDCLNSDTPDRKKGKPHLTNLTDLSPHLQHFAKMKDFFENCEFVGCHSSPPSKQGWIWTINATIRLYNNLKRKHSIKALSTRRLQQDPLENLFGTIRGNCGANYNPTTGQFVAGLKTAILSNLAHMGSGNCKVDDCTTMSGFKEILSTTSTADICTETLSESPLVSDMLSLVEGSFQESVSDSQELQACAYVCGFLLRSLGNKCKNCDSVLKAKDTNSDSLYTFIDFKEYDDIKKRLNYASEDFIRCVESCATMCNQLYEMSSYSLNIKKSTMSKLSEEINFRFLTNCQEHLNRNVVFITNSVFQITMKRFCVLKNRQFSDNQKGLKRKIDILQNK